MKFLHIIINGLEGLNEVVEANEGRKFYCASDLENFVNRYDTPERGYYKINFTVVFDEKEFEFRADSGKNEPPYNLKENMLNNLKYVSGMNPQGLEGERLASYESMIERYMSDRSEDFEKFSPCIDLLPDTPIMTADMLRNITSETTEYRNSEEYSNSKLEEIVSLFMDNFNTDDLLDENLRCAALMMDRSLEVSSFVINGFKSEYSDAKLENDFVPSEIKNEAEKRGLKCMVSIAPSGGTFSYDCYRVTVIFSW